MSFLFFIFSEIFFPLATKTKQQQQQQTSPERRWETPTDVKCGKEGGGARDPGGRASLTPVCPAGTQRVSPTGSWAPPPRDAGPAGLGWGPGSGFPACSSPLEMHSVSHHSSGGTALGRLIVTPVDSEVPPAKAFQNFPCSWGLLLTDGETALIHAANPC